MLSNRGGLSAQRVKLYIFLSAFAINFFLEVIIVANWLFIQYFLYATPMTIRIDFLSTPGNTLLWVASLYFVYITKEVAEETPRFRLVNRSLNAAFIGSSLLIFSVFLAIMSASTESAVKLSIDQLSFSASSIGYILSFAGSSLALITITAQNKSVLRLFLIYLISLLIPIEIWSLIHWVAYPFDIMLYVGFAWRGAFIELQLFYLTYPLILWLLIPFLFSWIWVPLVKSVKDIIKNKQSINIKAFLFGSQNDNEPPNEVACRSLSEHKIDASQAPSINRHVPAVILLLSIFLGVFVAYYPYISPRPGLVGADSLGYYYTLTTIADKDLYSAAQLAAEINRARVPYHLLLYFLKNLTQISTNAVIELMPIATILANLLAVFWFVKIGEKKATVACIAAVFSILSFNTTIAMHAGILANWLAMALGFVMFGLVLKFQEKMSFKLLFGAISASASVFLIHYWSGIFFLLTLGCYVFLMLLERRRHSTKFIVAMILLASVIIIAPFSSDLTTQFFIPNGSKESMNCADILGTFWKRLPIFIDSWFFGALANPVIMALALLGIALCFYQKTNFCRLLISWTMVGSLLSVFLSPIGIYMNQWLTWRTLYLIPFQIPATLGLFFLVTKLGSLQQDKSNVQQDGRDQQPSKSSFSLLKKQNFTVILCLIIDYVVVAILLSLDFQILMVLLIFNYLVLTLIFHFKINKRDYNPILVFIFVLFVTLLLFNYTLRSLAPLAVHRMQP